MKTTVTTQCSDLGEEQWLEGREVEGPQQHVLSFARAHLYAQHRCAVVADSKFRCKILASRSVGTVCSGTRETDGPFYFWIDDDDRLYHCNAAKRAHINDRSNRVTITIIVVVLTRVLRSREKVCRRCNRVVRELQPSAVPIVLRYTKCRPRRPRRVPTTRAQSYNSDDRDVNRTVCHVAVETTTVSRTFFLFRFKYRSFALIVRPGRFRTGGTIFARSPC